MKKPLTCLLGCALLLFSCNKSLEEYHSRPGIDLKFCNIKTWIHPHLGESRTNIFAYNSLGNPVSVTSDITGTGSGFHYFRYDDRNRLSEHEHEYVATYYYHYTGNSNRPYGDTRIDAYGREYAETFTWDEKGRIINVYAEFVYSPFEEEENPDENIEYVYEGNNLVRYIWNGHPSADVEYTSKPGVFATNKIWMLVNRNYSRNATTGAATFNNKGLPLTYAPQPGFQFSFLDMGFEEAQVSYLCK